MFHLPNEFRKKLSSLELKIKTLDTVKTTAFCWDILPMAFSYFIDEELRELNEDIFEVFKNHTGYSRATILKAFSKTNKDTPSRDLIDLICYFIEKKNYVQCVSYKYLENNIVSYEKLKTKIQP